jgi:hypothetical protein
MTTEAKRKRNRGYSTRARELNRKLVLAYLLANPCPCGETDPDLLDFDHVRGVKRKAISRMVQHGYSWVAIFREIRLTEVKCVRCHRKKSVAEARERHGRATPR